MIAVAPARKFSADTRLAFWILAAVLLHAMLLLTPSNREISPVKVLHRLNLSLSIPEPSRHQPTESIPQEAPVHPSQLKPVPAGRDPVVPPPLTLPAPSEPPSPLSAARLLELARLQDWQPSETTSPRRLGKFRPQPLPRNWRPSNIGEQPRSDDLMAAERAEVVDRWFAADGSHNVVVRTPSGETICGRAEVWSPLNPLYEPVMMWRPCAGGGKRSFRMPERYLQAVRDADRP